MGKFFWERLERIMMVKHRFDLVLAGGLFSMTTLQSWIYQQNKLKDSLNAKNFHEQQLHFHHA